MTVRPTGQRRVPGDVLVHLRRTRDHLSGREQSVRARRVRMEIECEHP